MIRFSGPLTKSDFDETWQDLAVSGEYRSYFNELLSIAPNTDLSGIAFETAKEEAERFVTNFEEPELRNLKRSAFVYKDEMHGASIRMFVAFVKANPAGDFDMETFASLDAAMDWLESGSRKRPPADRSLVSRVIQELSIGEPPILTKIVLV